jgi:hypothetical protein
MTDKRGSRACTCDATVVLLIYHRWSISAPRLKDGGVVVQKHTLGTSRCGLILDSSRMDLGFLIRPVSEGRSEMIDVF